MKLVYQYVVIFFNFSPISNHLHPLQVENSRLVVDGDDNGRFRPERFKILHSPTPLNGPPTMNQLYTGYMRKRKFGETVQLILYINNKKYNISIV